MRARAKFRDSDGITRRVSRFGSSQAAAQRKLREALRDRVGPTSEGRITDQSRLRDVAAVWLEELADSEPAAGTFEQYQRTLNRRVLPGLGGLRMCEMGVPAADRFIKAVRSNHGPSAAKSAKNVLSLVLALAVRHGALDSNPVREVAKVSGRKRSRPRALSVDETTDLQTRVYAEAGAHPGARMSDEADLGDIVRYLRGTGCRIGEALAVRREVVDMDAGVIEVNATLVRITGKGVVLQERTKSDAGWRIIAAPNEITELCRQRLARLQATGDRLVWVLSPAGIYRQVPASELGLIFPSSSGGLRSPSNTQRGLKTVLGRLNAYEWVVPHTFRKTVATRLDEAGCTARQIADQLGHARPSTTQDLYMGRGVACAEAARVL